MQGVGSNNDGILVLGATNLPWEIDQAVRRRFEKRIYISLPDIESRVAILKYSIGKTPHWLTDEDFREVGEGTEGYSGSDMATLCKDAIMSPLRKCQAAKKFVKLPDGKLTPTFNSDPNGIEMNMYTMANPELLVAPPVLKEDFMLSLTRSKKTVANEDLKVFEDWTEQFGQEG
jgi:vacuolar protein-sorting-associated protein 4